MKNIISIGFEIPGHEGFRPYSSDQSLLDADIIVFEPNFSCYTTIESYQGRPSFDENKSFQLKEATRHWKRELSTALQDRKTVFVFFGKYRGVFVHTGQKQL